MQESKPEPSHRDALAACAPFQGLSPELVERIFERVRACRFDTGETIIRQGETGDRLFVVVDGYAKASVRGHDDQLRDIATFERADIVGEMALVADMTRTADVVAETPVLALLLDAADFDAIAARNPDLCIVLTNLVADRLGQTSHDGLGGKQLGGYEIVRCIGRGGMAVVYEAEELATKQRVALKMMSHRLVYQPESVNRFRAEATIVQALHHPGIARLYKIFPGYRTWFAAMELCSGQALNKLIESRGRFPEPEVRSIVGQLAAALAYIHGRGVVHRDVKPSNAMLSPDGIAKLLDFGLAAQNVALDDRTLTHARTLVGTPFYMPPEQMSGGVPDARSDIYGLACIAYELLTGALTFKADNLVELIQAKMAHSVPPPAEIGDGVSAELHAFVERGLRPQRAERDVSLEAIAAWDGA